MAQAAEVRHLKDHVGGEVEITGWVETTRSHGKIGFVVVRDGTGIVQCVVARKEVDDATWERFGLLTQETTVRIIGSVRADARAPGGHELTVKSLEVLFPTVDEYPIQPKEHGVEFLLDNRHLWLRSSQQRAGLRVRDEVEKGIHDFFYDRGFVRIDSPILSGAIGESAGTLFETDYFGEKAYLAQTGQLYIEAAAAAFRKVYCFGPTFRAEKSKTRRHLMEFWMVEPEVAFLEFDGLCDLSEEFIVYLVSRVLERCQPELKALERDVSKLEAIKPPFPRITYTQAVEILNREGNGIQWGDDFGGDEETILASQFDRPVMITKFPASFKAFYMQPDPENPEVVLGLDRVHDHRDEEVQHREGGDQDDHQRRARAGDSRLSR